MKTNITYLTILFLLLTMASCDTIRGWLSGTKPLPRTVVIPDNALCTIDATRMEQNYIAHKDIKTDNEIDNRVISFTNKQMKDNIKYLTTEALKRGVNGDSLGFRVYLGVKRKEDFERGGFKRGELKSVQLGDEDAYLTVFFVATKQGDTEDANDYENIYEIPALDHGSSRRPPNPYFPGSNQCPLIGVNGHTH